MEGAPPGSSLARTEAPKLAVYDGAMGFQAATAEVWPETRVQRCWFHFVESFGDKYPKAVECLADDLFAFYDFLAAHWLHLRTTNPIESTFATVRLRHLRTKGCGTRKATLAMVYKLRRKAEHGWRRLDGSKFIPLVEAGIKFVNGERVVDAAARQGNRSEFLSTTSAISRRETKKQKELYPTLGVAIPS